jgi:phage terminase small subunit
MARPRGIRPPAGQGALSDGEAPLVDAQRLRPRERLFVEAYCGVANMNATKAYELAGYIGGRHNAARLITKDHVKAAIAEGLAAREARLVMSGQEAKERLTLIARGTIRPFLAPTDPLQALTDEDLALIKAITPNKYGRRIELHDQVKCVELMAKIAGALKDTVKVEHTLEDLVVGLAIVERNV